MNAALILLLVLAAFVAVQNVTLARYAQQCLNVNLLLHAIRHEGAECASARVLSCPIVRGRYFYGYTPVPIPAVEIANATANATTAPPEENVEVEDDENMDMNPCQKSEM